MASAPASAITIKYCCQSGKGEGRCVCVGGGGGQPLPKVKQSVLTRGMGDGGGGGGGSNHKTSLVTKGLAVQKIFLIWTMPGHTERWTLDAF